MDESPTQETHILNSNKKQINIINIINIIRDRKITSFCISEKIVKEFRKHCRLLGKRVNECTEAALLGWVQQNPSEHKTVVIQQKFVDEIETVQHRLEQKIICKELDFCLVTLDRITEKGIGDKDLFQERLITCLGQAIKIKNPNDILIELMEKVDRDGYIR